MANENRRHLNPLESISWTFFPLWILWPLLRWNCIDAFDCCVCLRWKRPSGNPAIIIPQQFRHINSFIYLFISFFYYCYYSARCFYRLEIGWVLLIELEDGLEQLSEDFEVVQEGFFEILVGMLFYWSTGRSSRSNVPLRRRWDADGTPMLSWSSRLAHYYYFHITCWFSFVCLTVEPPSSSSSSSSPSTFDLDGPGDTWSKSVSHLGNISSMTEWMDYPPSPVSDSFWGMLQDPWDEPMSSAPPQWNQVVEFMVRDSSRPCLNDWSSWLTKKTIETVRLVRGPAPGILGRSRFHCGQSFGFENRKLNRGGGLWIGRQRCAH